MAKVMAQYFRDCVIRERCLCAIIRFFSCILLMSNHVIFLVEFGINKQLQIPPKASCNCVCLWKNLLVLIYSKFHSLK